MRSSRHRNGLVAEHIAKAKFTEMGFVVSTPESEARYDMIVDNGELHKVQCKAAYHGEGYIRAEFRSTSARSNENIKKQYTRGEIDAFVVYNATKEELYWLWFDEAPATNAKRKLSSWRDHLVEDKLS